MDSLNRRLDPEVLVAGTLLILSCLSILFMSHLVAAPKVLFGRSLTAIAPTLFPYMILSSLAVLNAIFVLRCILRPEKIWLEGSGESNDWKRGVLLFCVMLFYALTMTVFGFFTSSALSLAMISMLVGNRSPVGIIPTAVVPPILLYLVATRVLAVSLPELSEIEFFIAGVLGETGQAERPSQ
ncbi:MAG: tripartite tricarboxylate transporter TctB family protein [Pseudomonadota bacterium]